MEGLEKASTMGREISLDTKTDPNKFELAEVVWCPCWEGHRYESFSSLNRHCMAAVTRDFAVSRPTFLDATEIPDVIKSNLLIWETYNGKAREDAKVTHTSFVGFSKSRGCQVICHCLIANEEHDWSRGCHVLTCSILCRILCLRAIMCMNFNRTLIGIIFIAVGYNNLKYSYEQRNIQNFNLNISK